MIDPMTWRRRHPRCEFCKYLKYDNGPSRLGLSCSDFWRCLVKRKIINFISMPRPFCPCYQAKEVDFEKGSDF